MEPVLIIPGFILLAFLIFIFSVSMDKDRIRNDVESRGGRVRNSSWTPFGPGWFTEQNDRFHRVTYEDADGNVHEAICKTNFWGSVYWRDDRIIRYNEHRASHDASNLNEYHSSQRTREELEEENRRLKDEIQRLRQ